MTNPYFSLLRMSWIYARDERPRYLIIYGLFILINLGHALDPLLLGWFVDTLQRDGIQVMSTAWIYIGCFFFLNVACTAINGPTRIAERQLAFNLSQNFLNELFHKALHLPMSWHQDHHSGSTIDRLRKAFLALRNFFQSGYFFFFAFAQFILSLIGMLYFSLVFGAIAVLLGALTIWAILKFDKPVVKASRETNEKEHILSASLSDSLSNIFTVITLRLENSMKIDLLGKFKSMRSPFRRTIVMNEWKWFTTHTLTFLIYIVMVMGYVYSHHTPGKVFQLGGLVALLGFVSQFINSFGNITQVYTQILTLNTDVQTVSVIEESYQRIHREENSAPLPRDWATINIDRLTFLYEKGLERRSADSDKVDYSEINKKSGLKGIKDIQLEIKRGQRIALVGESGSGKSTLLALLRGIYLPQSNIQLSVDGAAGYNWRSVMDVVTLLPQEPEIFENTILHNITLGLPFSQQEVLKACDLVCFTEVLSQLPNGLESSIQEKGVNLSVGQKQRLALARGILASRESSIVLMDEPTSSIDPQTEIQIYRQLFEAFADKAVVSSLHRLHLLDLFDYVYVFSEGRIIEHGTPKELGNGEYLRSASFAMGQRPVPL
jgi:ABC-type multidrug transport system fused ATPase/permease subunit